MPVDPILALCLHFLREISQEISSNGLDIMSKHLYMKPTLALVIQIFFESHRVYKRGKIPTRILPVNAMLFQDM